MGACLAASSSLCSMCAQQRADLRARRRKNICARERMQDHALHTCLSVSSLRCRTRCEAGPCVGDGLPTLASLASCVQWPASQQDGQTTTSARRGDAPLAHRDAWHHLFARAHAGLGRRARDNFEVSEGKLDAFAEQARQRHVDPQFLQFTRASVRAGQTCPSLAGCRGDRPAPRPCIFRGAGVLESRGAGAVPG